MKSIIPFLLILFLISCQKSQKDSTIENYKNPKIGDIYLINNTYDKDTSFYYLRLSDISSQKDTFSFFYTPKLYKKLPTNLSDNDYFVARNRNFTSDELSEFFEEKKIISIRRSKESSTEFNTIKPLDDKDLKFHLYPPYPMSKTWKILTSLRFETKFDEEIDDVVFVPKFTKYIEKLDKSSIIINAYMYAFDKDRNTILLSYKPINPEKVHSSMGYESVIEIEKSSNMKFKYEKACIIKGKLHINYLDFSSPTYQLSEIEFIECIE